MFSKKKTVVVKRKPAFAQDLSRFKTQQVPQSNEDLKKDDSHKESSKSEDEEFSNVSGDDLGEETARVGVVDEIPEPPPVTKKRRIRRALNTQ